MLKYFLWVSLVKNHLKELIQAAFALDVIAFTTPDTNVTDIMSSTILQAVFVIKMDFAWFNLVTAQVATSVYTAIQGY
jgi:hypothetical protein